MVSPKQTHIRYDALKLLLVITNQRDYRHWPQLRLLITPTRNSELIGNYVLRMATYAHHSCAMIPPSLCNHITNMFHLSPYVLIFPPLVSAFVRMTNVAIFRYFWNVLSESLV